MEPCSQDFETVLHDQLAAYACTSPLREAMAYTLLGGGKRVRPQLCLASCVAVGGERASAFHAAAAVEMIHAFSLVHDDLPALDNDDLRRGRPSLHKAYGEAMAILAGDALQTLALATALKSPTSGAAIAGEVAKATLAMIDGQVLDTLNDVDEGGDPESLLGTIHEKKTGALIACSCCIGGLAAGGEPSGIEVLRTYGRAVGLMFQIVDDLLDNSQTTAHLGKTAGKDGVLGRLTYVSLLGEAASRQRVADLEEEALAAAGAFGSRGEDLGSFARMLAVRTS